MDWYAYYDLERLLATITCQVSKIIFFAPPYLRVPPDAENRRFSELTCTYKNEVKGINDQNIIVLEEQETIIILFTI